MSRARQLFNFVNTQGYIVWNVKMVFVKMQSLVIIPYERRKVTLVINWLACWKELAVLSDDSYQYTSKASHFRFLVCRHPSQHFTQESSNINFTSWMKGTKEAHKRIKDFHGNRKGCWHLWIRFYWKRGWKPGWNWKVSYQKFQCIQGH